MFVFIRRRHHCRKCGRLVCADHSNNAELLPHIDKFVKQRICDSCADKTRMSRISRSSSSESREYVTDSSSRPTAAVATKTSVMKSNYSNGSQNNDNSPDRARVTAPRQMDVRQPSSRNSREASSDELSNPFNQLYVNDTQKSTIPVSRPMQTSVPVPVPARMHHESNINTASPPHMPVDKSKDPSPSRVISGVVPVTISNKLVDVKSPPPPPPPPPKRAVQTNVIEPSETVKVAQPPPPPPPPRRKISEVESKPDIVGGASISQNPSTSMNIVDNDKDVDVSTSSQCDDNPTISRNSFQIYDIYDCQPYGSSEKDEPTENVESQSKNTPSNVDDYQTKNIEVPRRPNLSAILTPDALKTVKLSGCPPSHRPPIVKPPSLLEALQQGSSNLKKMNPDSLHASSAIAKPVAGNVLSMLAEQMNKRRVYVNDNSDDDSDSSDGFSSDED